MFYMYEYTVKGYEEESYCHSGIVIGESFIDAVDRVASFYDDRTILKINVALVEDTENGLLVINRNHREEK